MVVLDGRTALDLDAVVVPRSLVDWEACVAPGPVVVAEIVRRGDGAADWLARLRACGRASSLRHVLVLDARHRRALWLRRAGAAGLGL